MTHSSSRVRVYQDESGMHEDDHLLILGFLLMEEAVERQLEEKLKSIAATEGVATEIHFRMLRKNVSGCSGAKFRVLEKWLAELHTRLVAGTVWLTVLAVDKEKIDPERIPENYMRYNRFSRMGIESTLARYAWELGSGAIRVIVHCDAHCLKKATDGHSGDNYGEYLRKQLRKSFNQKSSEKQRHVTLRGVRVHLDDSGKSMILQLVDGVLGAIRQHVVNDASRLSKELLAETIGSWLSGPDSDTIPFGHLKAQIFPHDDSGNGGSFSPIT
jgi:hypothetical protein